MAKSSAVKISAVNIHENLLKLLKKPFYMGAAWLAHTPLKLKMAILKSPTTYYFIKLASWGSC